MSSILGTSGGSVKPAMIVSDNGTEFTSNAMLAWAEGLTVRKRRARRRAVGARAPILVEAKPNARWSLDFVHDQFACGRRFRILNIVDDVTRECLAAIPDTSISGRRVARELTTLIEQRGNRQSTTDDLCTRAIMSIAGRFSTARPKGLPTLPLISCKWDWQSGERIHMTAYVRRGAPSA